MKTGARLYFLNYATLVASCKCEYSHIVSFCSILQLRSKHYFCSACMPQEDLDLEKHCAENSGDLGTCSRG